MTWSSLIIFLNCLLYCLIKRVRYGYGSFYKLSFDLTINLYIRMEVSTLHLITSDSVPRVCKGGLRDEGGGAGSVGRRVATCWVNYLFVYFPVYFHLHLRKQFRQSFWAPTSWFQCGGEILFVQRFLVRWTWSACVNIPPFIDFYNFIRHSTRIYYMFFVVFLIRWHMKKWVSKNEKVCLKDNAAIIVP